MSPPTKAVIAPSAYQGRRYTLEERTRHRLHGLVPSGPPLTLAQDVARIVRSLEQAPGEGAARELVRYETLMHVLERDETLFFAAAQRNLRKILPMIYTPAVGTACLNYSALNVSPRGLWIGIDQMGSIEQILRESQYDDVEVIVVTDGERILGLGDLAANGHGIPVGKLLLYSACGGIDPAKCLPVTLDVGCDVDKVRDQEFYIGLRQQRVRGDKYDAFVDEFMRAATAVYGADTLIQFEDFANRNALRLLNKYQSEYCCFNDDIQGTAAVGLAGILSALRMDGVPSSLSEHTFLFFGAGSAGLGIGNLIVQEQVRQGLDEDEARRRIFFIDSKGLIYDGRAEYVSDDKRPFAHAVDDDVKRVAKHGIAALVRAVKPTALIGVSTIYNAFDADVLRAMAELQRRPIIFALSNPTSKAECTAEAAYTATDGKAVFASGSPFEPVSYGSSLLVPGQGNNAYVFPGLGLGVVASKARHVSDAMVLASARRLSQLVSNEQLECSNVYPPLADLLEISAQIARAVAEQAVEDGHADAPVPDVDTIRNMMFAPGRNATVTALVN